MSDKSFGDHMSRGVVKNPLLSTAVTGLSIEDLTQNAVLLPVSRSQELFGRQEQIGLQTTLAYSNPNIPSGDANFTPINPPTQPQYTTTQQNAKNTEILQDKEDDFDVNEYFARLQGTRYVSAPINLKEDSNANLEAREENLEEINLNEPDRGPIASEDSQQSITADIAQNFSQLPTVLPQVASAVFSSFSNMLSMKSREVTPDEARTEDRGVKAAVDVADTGVPLHGVSEVKEVAPPPKEPPVCGPGNFRITTKKKYAQIPGLSSGETAQIPTYPPSFNHLPFFAPTNTENTTNVQTNVFNMVDIPNDNKENVEATNSTAENIGLQFNTQEYTHAPIIPPPPMFSNSAKRDSLPNAGKALLPPSVARRISANKPTINTQPPTFTNVDYFVPTPTSDKQPLMPTLAPRSPTSSLPYASQVSSQACIPSSNTLPTGNPPPPLTNAFIDMKTSTNASRTDIPMMVPTVSTINSLTSSLPPPPTFANQPPIFNLVQSVQETSNIPTSVPLTTIPNTAQMLNPYLQNTTTEIPEETKSVLQPDYQNPTTSMSPETKIPEPPKVGNTNFRMTKKRPQYYSGPIEGVGAISNNIKPTINLVDTTPFQGAVFTPDGSGYPSTTFAPGVVEKPVSPTSYQSAIFAPTEAEKQDNSMINTGYQNANLTTAEPSFVISNQYECNKSEITPFDINKPSEPAYNTNYNIPFDMSRQTTENYEPPKQESGFGIIGSLKSKLSSLDINKIQNSVTTFFDPTYNAGKYESKDPTHGEDPTYNSQSGIEIFVPNVETHVQPYDYNTYQANFTYGHDAIPNPSDYYQLQAHNMYSNQSYYSQPNYGTQSYSRSNISKQAYNQECSNNQIYGQENQGQQSYGHISSGLLKATTGSDVTENVVNYEHTVANSSVQDVEKKDDLAANQVYGEPKATLPINPAESNQTQPNLDENEAGKNIATQEVESLKDVMDNLKIKDILESSPNSIVTQRTSNEGNIISPFMNESKKLSVEIDTPISTNTNQPNYFDMLGTPDEKAKELVYKDNVSTASLFSAPLQDLSSMIATHQMSDEISETDDETLASDKIELDKDQASDKLMRPADLAKKDSIEDFNQSKEKADLTSQLIENITSPIQLLNPVVVPLTETHSVPIGFDAINQCAEISLIADETVETLQVQSAAELLDNEDATNVKKDYGWHPEDTFPPAEDILDHDYTFKMNTNIGFIGNNNFFFDKVVNKATDVKEFVSQDNPLVLQSQMSIPSAPPTEDFDETISDETGGIDVQSIEQDASNDFPVFDEYVIEPAEETGDAKDTFTNRVDRFKKLESSEDLTEHIPNTMLPSYFDTGNYAVESHFRKSITSPSTGKCSDDKSFRIPPGFEDYDANSEQKYKEPKIPDTITQTRVTETLTFSEISKPGFGNFDVKSEQKYQEPKIPDTVTQTRVTEILTFSEVSKPGFGNFDAKPEQKYEEPKIPDTITQTRVTETLTSSEVSKLGFQSFDAKPEDQKYIEPQIPDTITQTRVTETLTFSEVSTRGYEDYHAKPEKQQYIEPKIPDTVTQTRLTATLTFSEVSKPSFENFDAKPEEQKYMERQIPDIVTRTRLTATLTFSEVPTNVTTTTSELRMSPIAYETKAEAKFPDFASVFGAKMGAETSYNFVKEPENVVPVNPTTVGAPNEKVQEKKVAYLPDPMNFFAATEETNTTESVNRLASYFTSPAKTDNAKSFFELSQGQDHFRQYVNTDNSQKPFFELRQSENHYKEVPNITQEKYIADLNLMKDLTSCHNLEPTKELVVRTVNYFTVEYDDIALNKGEPSIKEREINKNNKLKRIEETLSDDEDSTKTVHNCKYCCDLKAGPVLNMREIDFDSIGKVSYRKAMDSGGNRGKDGISSQKEGKRETRVNLRGEDVSPDGDNSEGLAIMNENRMSTEYEPVKHHWFYRVDMDGKSTWRGFSTNDSAAIEKAFHSPDLNESTLVPTDGGRFDVNVVGRLRIAVYWNDKPTNVRRCSWFYKGTTDARYVPYSESVAEKLEEEYRHGITTGEWHRRLSLPNSELVVMHGPAVMVHFLQGGAADTFSAPNLFTFGKKVYRNPPKFKVPNDVPINVDHLLLLVHGAGEWRSQKEKIVSFDIQSTMRPRVVRRSYDESEIEDMEPSSIDHLLLLCHGVGSACDMRFRSVEEVVDDFRATSLQLLQSHYRNSCDAGIVGRVEVLPISWHASLHAGPCGVDRRLARVTLSSIPRLRNFTNDTVLDVLFYTSPHYTQMILDTVCGELNRVYNLFIKRNPDFKGRVSLGGHSLGSVILYDLLCNQETSAPLYPSLTSPQKQYLSGTAANNPIMRYPQLTFEPLAFYALGSPIAIFECIRGVESLGEEFCLPTCKNFFNIFHPYDPIAYRIEPLVNPELQNVKPSLIPHHKGRKRMHLELKETMARVGADLKQKLVESIKNTWTSMWASSAPQADHQLEKVVEEEMEKEEQQEEDTPKEEPAQAETATREMLGNLNSGRRVDYVLQEAPFEMINEYLFAMSSHVCYWESEDTMLLILREIYDSIGVCADVTVPQQSMTVQRTRPASEEKVNFAENPSTSRNGPDI